MKRLLTLTLLLLACFTLANAQSGSTSRREIAGLSLPATCISTSSTVDIFTLKAGGATDGRYWCSAANTWSKLTSLTGGAIAANTIIKSDGTGLVASHITDIGTNINIDAPNGITKIGDTASVGGAILLTVDNGTGNITTAGTFVVNDGIIPGTAGSEPVGSQAKPFQSLVLGNALNNTSTLQAVTLTGNRAITIPDADTKLPVAPQLITVAGMTAGRTWTVPDAAFSLARIDAAQTFTGLQTFSNSIAIGGNTVTFTNAILKTDGTNTLSARITADTDYAKFSGTGFLTKDSSGNVKWATGQTSAYETEMTSAGTIDFATSGTQANTSKDAGICKSASGVIAASDGNTTCNSNGTLKSKAITTDTNCADSAGAAACGSATAGSFVIDAAATSVVVSTTSVTANSQILIQEDSSLGTRLSVTCNTQSSLVLGATRVTARTAGTSFTVTIEVGPTTNPMCLNYYIIN